MKQKYTNESAAGRARAQSYGAGKPEKLQTDYVGTEQTGAQKVDPSIRLGDIKSPIVGDVPMSVQMAKPAAYQAKKGIP